MYVYFLFGQWIKSEPRKNPITAAYREEREESSRRVFSCGHIWAHKLPYCHCILKKAEQEGFTRKAMISSIVIATIRVPCGATYETRVLMLMNCWAYWCAQSVFSMLLANFWTKTIMFSIILNTKSCVYMYVSVLLWVELLSSSCKKENNVKPKEIHELKMAKRMVTKSQQSIVSTCYKKWPKNPKKFSRCPKFNILFFACVLRKMGHTLLPFLCELQRFLVDS